jgi:hypothetical protein
MRRFTPSAAFTTYYTQVLTLARAPITPGMGPASIPLPVLSDPEERAFAETTLAPLVAQVNIYRASVPAVSTLTAPPAADYGGSP